MTAGTDPSLSQAIAPVAVGDHVVATCWLKGVAAFATVGGSVVLARGDEVQRVEAHPGAGILSAAGDGARLLTGGDDGRVAETLPDGSTRTLAAAKGGWIDALALSTGGAFAFATGRRIVSRDGRGTEKFLEVPSTARGLAFAPKGYRLAASHYNGATLWFPNVEGRPENLEWKGSHLDVTWSPDARFVVTSMQENSLHGWRLQPDKGHMRMSGYPAKTRSLSWSHDGKWLATSGAEAAIIWPFESRDGPMGKAPRECGVRPARVSRVAFHPGALVLAAGYEDGCLLLIRLADASELLVRAPVEDRAAKDGAITALSWNDRGRHLAFGCANGDAGILTLPA